MTAFHCLLVGIALASGHLRAADPREELAQVSGLGPLSAARLKGGEVISARGSPGGFARGVYIESCFYVKAPAAAVEAALLQWDPSKHPPEDVAAYEMTRAPGGIDFSRLTTLDAKRAADRWMLDQSRAVADGQPGDLHLTSAEEAVFRAEPQVSAAWKRILERRAGAVSAGGLGAAGPYRAADLTIDPPQEYRRLIGMTPKIAARFAGMETAATNGYAERGLTQGHTSFSLGVLTSRPGAQSTQVMDCTYYPSDTYLLSADLYELWAWEGGTLVWQVDYISAAFRPYTRGLDKLFAGREMIKETGKSIDVFRRSLER